ncbi:restriction endonuclease subunit S [Kocuria sp. CPCC 205292]|uniref:restriction endonuclease subunit S n=1 Tax=Kocuria cellulosilytica TaxID=3071451 RepID=UPI0034D77EF2
MKFVPLSEVARIDRDSIQPGDIKKGTTYVGLENIASGGSFVDVVDVSAGTLASNKFKFTREHILYGKLRPYLAKIALPEFSGICSTDILPIKVGEQADRRFIAHYLRQNHMVNKVNSLATGANLPRISPKILATIEVPFLPLENQRRIANTLDKADALRAKRREAIIHLDALSISIYNEIFGDSLVDSDRRWPHVSVAEVCSHIVDCVNRTAPITPNATPYKMIRTTNVRNRSIDLTDVRFVDEETFNQWNRRLIPRFGDVVLTREAPMGEAGIVPAGEKVFLGQRTMLYRADPSRLTAEYLLYTLTSRYMKTSFSKHGAGTTVKHLSVPYCRNFHIPLPPLGLQQEFTDRITALDTLRAAHRAQLAALDSLFLSLQNRAFKGEL